MKPDGVKPDGVKPDGVKPDGVKREDDDATATDFEAGAAQRGHGAEEVAGGAVAAKSAVTEAARLDSIERCNGSSKETDGTAGAADATDDGSLYAPPPIPPLPLPRRPSCRLRWRRRRAT